MDTGLTRQLSCGFDEAVERLSSVLRAEAFDVLTDIDMSERLRRTLGVGFRRYRILGARGPAHCADCTLAICELDDGRVVVRSAKFADGVPAALAKVMSAL